MKTIKTTNYSPAKFWLLCYWSFFALFYWNMFQIFHCCVNYRALSWFVKPKKKTLDLIFPICHVTCVNLCHPWPFWFFLASLVFCCIHKVLYYFMVSFFYRQYPWAVSTNQRNKIFAEVLFTICLSKENWHGESR